jgi:hypothetical protein
MSVVDEDTWTPPSYALKASRDLGRNTQRFGDRLLIVTKADERSESGDDVLCVVRSNKRSGY